jgi:hypothetical protein
MSRSRRKSVLALVAMLLFGYFAGSCTPAAPGGAAGPTGLLLDAKLVSNPARLDLFGTGAWVPLPSATASMIVSTGPASIVVHFWTAVACVGAGRKSVRVLVDGTAAATGPLSYFPATTPSQTEITTTLQASRSVSPGTHTVAIEVQMDTGSGCTVTPDLWNLQVELLAV